MRKLQESQESCPSVTSVLNLMIDHSGNIVEDRGGPTMGGGDLISPVANVQEENKSIGGSPTQPDATPDLPSVGTEAGETSGRVPATQLSSVSATSHSNGRGCPKRVWTLTGAYLM